MSIQIGDSIPSATVFQLTAEGPTGIQTSEFFAGRKVVLVGTNTGGSIAICVAADDPRVSAAALLSPRADFDDWVEHPRRFLDHAREIGAHLRLRRQVGDLRAVVQIAHERSPVHRDGLPAHARTP